MFYRLQARVFQGQAFRYVVSNDLHVLRYCKRGGPAKPEGLFEQVQELATNYYALKRLPRRRLKAGSALLLGLGLLDRLLFGLGLWGRLLLGLGLRIFPGNFSRDFLGHQSGDHLRGFSVILLGSLLQQDKKQQDDKQYYYQDQRAHQREGSRTHVFFDSLVACLLPGILEQ